MSKTGNATNERELTPVNSTRWSAESALASWGFNTQLNPQTGHWVIVLPPASSAIVCGGRGSRHALHCYALDKPAPSPVSLSLLA